MVLGLVGFRSRGQWTPGMEVRAEDRCQIGKSWIIAKEDHVASESFAEDADKWDYLVDCRGLDDLDTKLATLQREIEEANAATEDARAATIKAKQATALAQDAVEVFGKVYGSFDSDDWLYAICDAKGMLLWGIRTSGETYQAKGIPEDVRKWLESLHTLEDYEDVNFVYTIADSAGNIVWGIKKNGEVYEPKGMPDEVKNAIAKQEDRIAALEELGYHVTESDDYAYVIADASDNVVFAIDHKGRTVLNAIRGVVTVERFDSLDYIYAVTDSTGNLLYGVKRDGTFCASKFDLPLDLAELISKAVGGYLTEEDEEEFIYKIQDAGGHIVFGVFASGRIYAPKGMPEETKRKFDEVAATLSDHAGQIEYVKTHGKDWSGEKSLHIPFPVVPSRVEITVPRMPTSKFDVVPGTLKLTDCFGNSFEKPILINNQGNISAGFDQKNFSIDILNTAGDDDDTFELQVGTWPVQDSFHLKAYVSDFWKIRSLGVYRHAEQIAQARDAFNRRPWDRIFGASQQTSAQVLKGGVGDIENEMHNGGMGHPDGFPFFMYINGAPWGLYTWNLKKHKDNYNITKNDNDGKQVFFGDYMTGVFERYNNAYWQIQDYNFRPTSIDGNGVATYGSGNTAEKWDKTKGYDVNAVVYDEDTFDWTVGGKTSSVTVRRLFKLATSNNATFAGYEYDEEGYPCQKVFYTDEDGQQQVRRGGRITTVNTMRPQYVNWRQLEVRNPKKKIAFAFGGNDENGKATYKLEYYDYDNGAKTGIPETTHEPLDPSIFAQKEVTKLMATGETEEFSKKEYTRSVNLRATIEEYSWVIPIIESTLTAQNLSDWGFETEAEAKKAIFAEHHDVDFAIDFFLVYNDCDCLDYITHNTLYVMYDGKHVVPTHYDTDISMGMNSTYTNSFPAVYASIRTAGHTFTQYLWQYFKAEIKERWAKYRDAGVISGKAFENGVVWRTVSSITRAGYEESLRVWPDQPAYRKPVYWRMPAGSIQIQEDKDGRYHGYDETLNGYGNMPAALKALYDADPASVEWDAAKQYLTAGTTEQVYCVVTDGDTLHWYQCTVNNKGIAPGGAYTCGSPTSGGVFDSPRRIIEWFKKRLAYMDSLMEYTPSASAAIMEAIQGAVATDDDIMALFG